MFKAIYQTLVKLYDFVAAVASLLLTVFVSLVTGLKSLTIGLGLVVIIGSLPKSERLGFDTVVDTDSITLVATSTFNVPWLVGGLLLFGSVWGIIVHCWSKTSRKRRSGNK